MGIKQLAATQYRDKVNRVSRALPELRVPPEGWLRTVRKALGMSTTDVGQRLGRSRALVSNTEKAELDGSVSLKGMQRMAEAMDCRFVYALVPNQGNVEGVLQRQAEKKALKLVEKASEHMALEAQNLTMQEREAEIKRLAEQLLREMPSDFWKENDEHRRVSRRGDAARS